MAAPGPRGRHHVPGRSWQVIERHYGGRNAFSKVYKEYEAKVARHVQRSGIPREQLRLNPGETAALFNTESLEALLAQVEPLLEASHALFRREKVSELYDSEVSKIFHELSILREEHLSVRDFPRDAGGREFNRLFREVSEYYPQRLRRVRDRFTRAQKRLDALLPSFQGDVILLRSAFLFRTDLWPDSPDTGLTRFLTKMYPEAGAADGYLAIARTFRKGVFVEEALTAARMGIGAASKPPKSGSRPQNLKEIVRELDKIVDKSGKELRELEALREQEA